SAVDNNQNTTHSYTSTGTYLVSFIAANAYGACTTSVSVIISASAGCDTLNFPPPGTLTVYGDGGTGYAIGSNQYGDLAKAQRFSSYTPYTHLTGGIFYLFDATDGGNGAIARFTVWDQNAGVPNVAISTV